MATLSTLRRFHLGKEMLWISPVAAGNAGKGA
jgi:hypothetical protein